MHDPLKWHGVQARRLSEVIAAFREAAADKNAAEVGHMHLVRPCLSAGESSVARTTLDFRRESIT